MSINQLSAGPILVTQLINHPIVIPFWLTIFFGFINLILLFLIIQKLKDTKTGFIAALLYALSPWTAYLEVSSSPYIFSLTLLLVLYMCIQKFNIDKKVAFLLVILISTLSIFRLNQITIFSNVGLLNAVNSFRGETNQTVFASLGKVIENRYIYFSEHVIFNVLKQFTPATYFANQVRLLGFSFSPPIFLGFIIPFFLGLFKVVKSFKKSKITNVILVAFLMLPSILSQNSPDLSSLVIISPIIFFIISIGICEFILKSKKKVFRFLLLLTILMVAFQFITTISDIATREPIRLQMFLK